MRSWRSTPARRPNGGPGLADDAAAALDLSGPSALALRARAALALAGGDPRSAAKSALDAVAVLGDTHPLERERSWLLAGRALAAIGDPAALGLIDEAHARLGEFGAHRLQAHAARDRRAPGAQPEDDRAPHGTHLRQAWGQLERRRRPARAQTPHLTLTARAATRPDTRSRARDRSRGRCRTR